MVTTTTPNPYTLLHYYFLKLTSNLLVLHIDTPGIYKDPSDGIVKEAMGNRALEMASDYTTTSGSSSSSSGSSSNVVGYKPGLGQTGLSVGKYAVVVVVADDPPDLLRYETIQVSSNSSGSSGSGSGR